MFKKEFVLNINWNKNNPSNHNESDKECELIKNDLSKIEGIKRVSLNKSGYSNIIAVAKWKKSEARKHLDKIRNIDNIKSVEARIIQ